MSTLPFNPMHNSSPLMGLYTRLFGEEKPRDMWMLSGILVFLLHVWLFAKMNAPAETIAVPKPLEMAVEMVTLPKPKPVAAPPKPVEPPKPKPQPKKVPVPPRPVAHKPPPEVQQKAPDFAPIQEYKPTPAPVTEAPSTASTAAPSTSSSKAEAETVTEANYKANYLHNPKPDYPAIARSRGWTGKVLLKVHVTADGEASSVAVHQSSGHEILDEAALDAVRQWKFVPAKRGDTPVAGSVIVPMVFSLNQ